LIQETEQFMATLGARVVLVDDTGIRATLTASWLLQMGWSSVRVLDPGIGAAGGLEIGGETRPPALGVERLGVVSIDAAELRALMARGEVRIFDVSTSARYREGHISSALNLLRSQMLEALAADDGAGAIILTCEDGVRATFAGHDLHSLRGVAVRALSGGNRAWQQAGLGLEHGSGRSLCAALDRYQRPYEKDWGDEQAMRDYLSWEVALIPKLERDASARFAGI